MLYKGRKIIHEFYKCWWIVKKQNTLFSLSIRLQVLFDIVLNCKCYKEREKREEKEKNILSCVSKIKTRRTSGQACRDTKEGGIQGHRGRWWFDIE